MFGVTIEMERAHSRAPVTAITLAWWRKQGEEFRATYQERQRSKLGRKARLRGEEMAPSPALPFSKVALPAPENNKR